MEWIMASPILGNNGTLVLSRNGWEVIEEKQSKNKVSKSFVKPTDNGLDKHWVNFIDVVRSRKMEDLRCSIEAGAHVATVAQMGNISFPQRPATVVGCSSWKIYG